MALNPLNSSDSKQLTFKGLIQTVAKPRTVLRGFQLSLASRATAIHTVTVILQELKRLSSAGPKCTKIHILQCYKCVLTFFLFSQRFFFVLRAIERYVS